MTIEPKITNAECAQACGVGVLIVDEGRPPRGPVFGAIGGAGLAFGEGAQGFEFAGASGVRAVGMTESGGFAPDAIGAGVAELDPPEWGIDAALGIVALIEGGHKSCVPKCAQGDKSKQGMAGWKRQKATPIERTACRRFNSAPSHHFLINTLRGLCALSVPKLGISRTIFSFGGVSHV